MHLRLYWELTKRSFRRYATYRGAVYAGAITNTVFGFLKAYIMLAVFSQRPEIGGFDAVDAVTFAWMTQVFIASVFGGHLDLAEDIRTGDVVTELYRPVDLQAYWLSTFLGAVGFQTLLRGLMPLVAAVAAFELTVPSHPLVWLGFLASALLGIVVSFAHRFIVSLTTFWLLDYRGTSQVATVLVLFFSGMVVPIVLFPDWLESIARVLPYAAMLQLPLEVFLGKHTGTAVLGVLAVQLLWAGVLLLAGRALLAAATHKVVVQGG